MPAYATACAAVVQARALTTRPPRRSYTSIHTSGMKDRVPPGKCPWYEGPSLFEVLDGLEPQDRDPSAPFRMPIMSKYKEDGKTFVLGKSESGTLRRGETLMIMPNKTQVKVTGIYLEAEDVPLTRPGENIRVRVLGVEEEDVSAGFVLCSVVNPIPVVTEFDALLSILELLEHKSIFTAGYKCVLHIHNVTEECEVIDLHYQIDPKTKQPIRKKCVLSRRPPVAQDCVLASVVPSERRWLLVRVLRSAWGAARWADRARACVVDARSQVPLSQERVDCARAHPDGEHSLHGALQGLPSARPLHAARRGTHNRHRKGGEAARGAQAGGGEAVSGCRGR